MLFFIKLTGGLVIPNITQPLCILFMWSFKKIGLFFFTSTVSNNPSP